MSTIFFGSGGPVCSPGKVDWRVAARFRKDRNVQPASNYDNHVPAHADSPPRVTTTERRRSIDKLPNPPQRRELPTPNTARTSLDE